MRFLRTNASNKSRGKSKSNSMFLILRKKNTTIQTKQEPSSPKVTCMGQVRVKTSSSDRSQKNSRCRFWWVPHTLFCCYSGNNTNSECCFPFRRKDKASKVSEGSKKNKSKESERKVEIEHKDEDEEDENRVIKDVIFVSNLNDYSSFSSTPPRNALLLTRCKSLPYSSSSLASRFLGSPLRNEETEQPIEEKQSESVSNSKLRFLKELEDSSLIANHITVPVPRTEGYGEPGDYESERVGEMKRKEEESLRDMVVVLTRCKSERTRKT